MLILVLFDDVICLLLVTGRVKRGFLLIALIGKSDKSTSTAQWHTGIKNGHVPSH